MNRPFLLAGIFIIGCATGGVASQLVVPQARAGTTPTRWEYHCVQGEGMVAPTLTRIGAEGWEMTSAFASHYSHETDQDLHAAAYTFCFKRPAS